MVGPLGPSHCGLVKVREGRGGSVHSILESSLHSQGLLPSLFPSAVSPLTESTDCSLRYKNLNINTPVTSLRGFCLSSWDEIVPKFKYSPAQPYFNILVHTVDSIRMASLLETCLEVGRPVLLNGTSGVGKSAVIVDTLERLALTTGQAAAEGRRGSGYVPVVSQDTCHGCLCRQPPC